MPKKIIVSLMLITIFLSACGSEQSSPVTIEQPEESSVAEEMVEEPTTEMPDYDRLEIESADGTILVGSLHLPEGQGPFPAFVWVHGSGAVTRTQGGGSVVPALVEGGYAVLIMDKRGVGESSGDYFGVSPVNSDFILGQLAEDTQAAAEFLSQLNIINPNQIGLFGNSQAGWIIPLAAAKSAEVSLAVILVGPTVTVGEENYYSSLTQENSATLTEEKLEQVYERYSTFSGQRGFDPRESIESLDIPVLWVLGGKDSSIPTSETVRILDEIIAEYDKEFTVHIYPLGTHGLQNVENGEQIKFMDDVVYAWIEATLIALP